LAHTYPGIELTLIDRHPVEALQMLRHGKIDVALVFRHADAPVEDVGFRLLHIGDDPIYLISQRPDDSLANHRHSAWIGGCHRCQSELLAACLARRLHPPHRDAQRRHGGRANPGRRRHGVTTLPGLALQAHRRPDIHATELAGSDRQICAATYGDPPDPPVVSAVLAALSEPTTPTSSTDSVTRK
jgi:DNA-binding transcriptional LysR family regulator